MPGCLVRMPGKLSYGRSFSRKKTVNCATTRTNILWVSWRGGGSPIGSTWPPSPLAFSSPASLSASAFCPASPFQGTSSSPRRLCALLPHKWNRAASAVFPGGSHGHRRSHPVATTDAAIPTRGGQPGAAACTQSFTRAAQDSLRLAVDTGCMLLLSL